MKRIHKVRSDLILVELKTVLKLFSRSTQTITNKREKWVKYIAMSKWARFNSGWMVSVNKHIVYCKKVQIACETPIKFQKDISELVVKSFYLFIFGIYNIGQIA